MVKDPATKAGDARDSGSIPGSERSLGDRNGNLLQYSCLGNPTYRGGWWATVHGVTKESDMTEHTHTYRDYHGKEVPSEGVVPLMALLRGC